VHVQQATVGWSTSVQPSSSHGIGSMSSNENGGTQPGFAGHTPNDGVGGGVSQPQPARVFGQYSERQTARYHRVLRNQQIAAEVQTRS
jgi:hypothetical protein